MAREGKKQPGHLENYPGKVQKHHLRKLDDLFELAIAPIFTKIT